MGSSEIRRKDGVKFAPPPSGKNNTKQDRKVEAYDLMDLVVYEENKVLIQFLGESDTINRHLPSNQSSTVEDILTSLLAQCASQLIEIHFYASPEEGRNEHCLYSPLETICKTIERLAEAHYSKRHEFRQMVRRSESPMIPELSPFRKTDPGYKPDFLIVDVPPPPSGKVTEPYDRDRNLLWRQCPSFMEVKAKASDSPLRASRDSTEPAKQTLVQGYDYASMILSERPFLDFVYGLFFCGDSFCLARFDRCNIALSAMYDIYNPEKDNFDSDGLRIFIRIMLRMLWEASAVELGFNTAVKFAPTNPPQTFYQAAYPQFIVTMGFHGSTEEWHTYGPPLWASPSAVASRGSWIWRTMDHIDKIPVILKVAWRSEGRMGERGIYMKIERLFRERGVVKPPGMVRTSGRGGDVYYAKGKRLSVAARRNPFFDILEVNAVTDRVLHLVSIIDFGKSLWKYSGTLEFALTMSQVIEAHKILCKNGILHRDVSAGNILINVNAMFQPETGEEHAAIVEWDYDPESDAESLGGFLADFEFASFEHTPTTRETIASGLSSESHLYFTEKIVYDTPRERGDGLTGTPTFMATELLRAITTGERIHRTARQDLESFAWVILYAIYRHTLDELPHSHAERKQIEQEFIELFAATSAKDIVKTRGDKFLFGGTTAVQTLLTYITNSRYHHLRWLIQYAWDALDALQPRQEATDGPPDEDQSDDARFSRDHLAPISLKKRPKPTHPVEHDGFLRALGFIINAVKRDMEVEKQKAGENLAAGDVGTVADQVALDSERRQWYGLGRKMTGPQVVA